jgi:hypothetical protein
LSFAAAARAAAESASALSFLTPAALMAMGA